MTRTQLRALPLADLHALADPLLRAQSERYGWRPMRAVGLPRWLLCEVVLTAELRRGRDDDDEVR